MNHCPGNQRLLIVSDTMPPDPNGIALIAFHTAEVLSTYFDVHVIGPRGAQFAPRIIYSGIRRLPLGTPDLHIPAPAFRVMSEAVSRADRVVVHTPGPLGLSALHYARRFGKDSTLFQHNDYPALMRYGLPSTFAAPVVDWLAQRIDRWSVAAATRVVASSGTIDDHRTVLRLEPPRYGVVAAPEHANGQITVAYHGRVSREKAVDTIVRAIDAADPDHRRLRLRIIGEGSQLPSTLRLATTLGVPVQHVPWCSDPRRELTGAQIYVTASRTETYSMTTLEAMGCGIPIIARSVGSIPEYVHHGTNGLLFDADAQLPNLITMLMHDSEMRRRLGESARASATPRSLWEQFAAACGDPGR